MDYLAKCAGDDCTTVEAGDLSFFKIDEKGLNDAATQNWASDDLIANDFAWTVTVPEDIAPGQYVLRHEIIALHSAQDANGAQNYPQCINIEVTGSGTAEPASIPATEFYTASDPGISLSIYNGLTDYEIPGPAVYSGGASGSAPSTGGSSSAASSAASSTAPMVTSSAPYATSNSTTKASAPTSTAAETTSEAYPEPTGEPTFAGSSATSTSCTTTITLTGSSAATASATQSSTPVETSDNSDDDSEGDYEEGDSSDSSDNSSDNSSSDSSNNTPTTTSIPAADVSAVASSLPSSVVNAPIPTSTSSSDKANGKPSKALPEGFTLKDLLEWVNYLLSKAYNEEGKHARDVTRR